MLIVATTGQCGSRVIMQDLIENGYQRTAYTNLKTYEDKRILQRWKPQGYIDDWAVNKLLKEICKAQPDAVIKVTNINILRLAHGKYDMIGLFRHPELWLGRLERKQNTERTIDFWIEHGNFLLDLHHENPFPIVEHGDDYVKELGRAMQHYGKRLDHSSYDKAMINGHRAKVPEQAIDVYNQLRKVKC